MTALAQTPVPEAHHLAPESRQYRQIPRYRMVLVIAAQHALQPFSDLRNRRVHPPAKFLLQFLQEILLRAVPPSHIVRTEQPITCPDSEPEPDLSVVKGLKEDFRDEHPHTAELVIEICVSSHEYDRAKLRAYASAGVKESWLVLGPEKQIEVHRRPAGDQFADRTVYGPGGRLSSATVPEFSVDLDALFAK